MPDIVITYDILYEVLSKEKSRKELQKLDQDFFQSVIKYLEEKELILKSQKNTEVFTTETKKTEKQIQNIKKIIQQLYEKRERKIIETAIFSSRSKKPSPELIINMLPEEKEFYNSLLEIINKNKKEFLLNLLNNKKAKILKSEKNENSTILLRFLEPVPRFLGTDGFTYGPFEKEDIANLQSNIANLIIKKNKAEKIET